MPRSNIGECRECGAPIAWMVTMGGKNIAADLDSVDDEEQEAAEDGDKVMFERGRHTCHWDSCK